MLKWAVEALRSEFIRSCAQKCGNQKSLQNSAKHHS